MNDCIILDLSQENRDFLWRFSNKVWVVNVALNSRYKKMKTKNTKNNKSLLAAAETIG